MIKFWLTFLLLSCSLFPLNKHDVILRESDLKEYPPFGFHSIPFDSDCTIVARPESSKVSKSEEFFLKTDELTKKGSIRPIIEKTSLYIKCKSGVAGIYYLKFTNNRQSAESYEFASKFIWGNKQGFSSLDRLSFHISEDPKNLPDPSLDRLTVFEDYMILVSFPEIHPGDFFLKNKLGHAGIPNESLERYRTHFTCKSNEANSACDTLKILASENTGVASPLPSDAVLVGEFWLLDKNEKWQKSYAFTKLTSISGKQSIGIFKNLIPDNAAEEAEYKAILSGTGSPSKGLMDFIRSEKMEMRQLKQDGGVYYMVTGPSAHSYPNMFLIRTTNNRLVFAMFADHLKKRHLVMFGYLILPKI